MLIGEKEQKLASLIWMVNKKIQTQEWPMPQTYYVYIKEES